MAVWAGTEHCVLRNKKIFLEWVSREPKKFTMSEHDFKLNVDSLIERLLEGKPYCMDVCNIFLKFCFWLRSYINWQQFFTCEHK